MLGQNIPVQYIAENEVSKEREDTKNDHKNVDINSPHIKDNEDLSLQKKKRAKKEKNKKLKLEGENTTLYENITKISKTLK